MRRLFIAIPVALTIAFGLFMLMAWMIHNGAQAPEKSDPVRFNMMMVEKEQKVHRRDRTPPPKPDAPTPPKQQKMTHQKQTASSPDVSPQASPVSVKSLGLDTAITGINVDAPSIGDIKANQQAMPMYRVNPRYPSRAQSRGIEGFVVLKFTIDASGHPVDIEIIKAKPKHMFEREARRALRRWKYKPKEVGGQAVSQPGQTVKLEFRLTK
ncbi:energy transducer TonB [Vibrio palustris]|uniref:Protein TonB n=1 Tax=Vibrio palustris TaxID=1918946 RepID=A0A1R4B2K7_9VIBR|nr:energy transducer TonB [Vibrio palustris]SJL83141.1 transport protein TonB [Vibrio palustris]